MIGRIIRASEFEKQQSQAIRLSMILPKIILPLLRWFPSRVFRAFRALKIAAWFFSGGFGSPDSVYRGWLLDVGISRLLRPLQSLLFLLFALSSCSLFAQPLS